MPLALSALDLVPLPEGVSSGEAARNSLHLAEVLDRLGYHRVWYAEHHNLPTVGSTTPEVFIGLAAARTQRIRVGSGGVMLPNHAPLKVAETYKLLESLYPGRIDLGIGRAPGTDPATAVALRGSREALAAEDFPARLEELMALGSGGMNSPFSRNRKIEAIPTDTLLPEIFLLGSSEFSARLSATLGTGFGFAAHFSDLAPEGPMRDYKFRFTPGYRPQPHSILTLGVVCADSAKEAEYLAKTPIASFVRLRTGRTPALLRPEAAQFELQDPRLAELAGSIRGRMYVGTAPEVWEQIQETAERCEADEVMVTTLIHDVQARERSYELLAQAAGISQPVLPN